MIRSSVLGAKLSSEPTEAAGRGLAPTREAQTLQSDEICWRTSNSIRTGAATERPCATNHAAETVRGSAGTPQRWRKSTEGCRMA